MKLSILSAFLPTMVSAMAPCVSSPDAGPVDPYAVSSLPQSPRGKRATTYIDLWFHFLISGPNQPAISTSGIYAQLSYLNTQYGKWGFQFILKPISIAMNANWASSIDADKAEKMKQLHRGNYGALNIYAVEGATSGVCSFPDSSGNAVSQTTLDGDGCFIPLASAQKGVDGTATHEIGHWLGLYHVFQGGCAGTDYCDDTAAQDSPSYSKMAIAGDFNSCPARDSCPALSGTDNIKNFMDYTDCSSEFTACQGSRMTQVYANYRANRAIASGVMWK